MTSNRQSFRPLDPIYPKDKKIATFAVGNSPGIVPNDPPIACFTWGATGLLVDFDASCSSDPDGAVDEMHWDFGDGDTQDTPSLITSHTYDAPGTYTVSLIVTDGEGLDSVAFTDDVTVATTVLTFVYTGAPETFEVPAGYTTMTIEAVGAATSSDQAGARVVASFPIDGIFALVGDEFDVYVGGHGDCSAPFSTGAGGWPDGGDTGLSGDQSASFGAVGGPGSSDVRTVGGGTADRILVAGAAGGGGRRLGNGGYGGTGGYPDGTDALIGAGNYGGEGATASAGGAGGAVPAKPTYDGGAGTFGQGGVGGVAEDLVGAGNQAVAGGGGGGGYYGGGGGAGGTDSPTTQGSGGGGGSSYVDSAGTLIDSDDNYDLVGSSWEPEDWDTDPDFGNGRVVVTFS